MKQEREKSTAMRLTLYPLAEPGCKKPGGLGSWDLKKADLRGREKKASSCCLRSQFSGLPAVDAPPKRHTHSLQLPFSEGRHTEKPSPTSQGKQARKEKGLGPLGEGIIRMLQGLLDRDPGPITFPMRKGNRMLGISTSFLPEASDTNESSAFGDSIKSYRQILFRSQN